MQIKDLTLDTSQINKLNIPFWGCLKSLLNKNPELVIPDSAIAYWLKLNSRIAGFQSPECTINPEMLKDTYLNPDSPEIIFCLLMSRLPNLITGIEYDSKGWNTPEYEVSFEGNVTPLITFCEQYTLTKGLSFSENKKYTYSTNDSNLKDSSLKACVILACHAELDNVTWEKKIKTNKETSKSAWGF